MAIVDEADPPGSRYKAEYERRIAERREKLTSDSRAIFRAMDGWARVESIEAWHEMVEEAVDDIESGQFLIDRLGASGTLTQNWLLPSWCSVVR